MSELKQNSDSSKGKPSILGSSSKKHSSSNEVIDVGSVSSSKSIDSLFIPQMEGIKQRGFIGGNNFRHPLFSPLSNQPTPSERQGNEIPSSDAEASSSITQVFWGTNINFHEIFNKFRQFLLNFHLTVKTKDGEDYINYYHKKLEEIRETRVYLLTIDGNHLKQFDKMMYWQLINYPTEMIPIMDGVANHVYNEVMESKKISEKINNQIQVRPINLVDKSRLRDLGPDDIDRLISINGIVIRTSEIIPEMREAYFKCTLCGQVIKNFLQRSIIIEPIDCPHCKGKSTFELIHNFSGYNDKQHIKVQETPESMPEGETPVTVHLCAYDELVDSIKPGDRCEFVGIFRAQGVRVNPRVRVTKTTFRTYLDIVSIQKYNKLRMNIDDERNDDLIRSGDDNVESNEVNEIYKEELKEEVEALKKNEHVYDILVESLAPSIWENDDVKKGLLLQLFGGVTKDFSKSGQGKFRGDINVLLVGDPSTAKSQLLQYVHNISPRGIYTSGKGSSVVGLTAYITKDPETRELILESGALVLSDRGICCIDEFDKMDDSTKVILHEAMEQQTISIAKAGIICQLNARTAILASANPIHSKYDPKLSVVQNIRLPPSLLSRFDLIYLMLDKHNEVNDRRLANHIVSMYADLTGKPRKEEDENKMEIEVENEPNTKKGRRGKSSKSKKSKEKAIEKEIKEEKEEEAKEKLQKDGVTYVRKEVLTQYISEAKKLNPKIGDDIVSDLIRYYIDMRQLSSGKNTISATPRQLESVIRLSEAMARVRFSEVVTKDDVEEALRLIKVATQQAATDPMTGVIDMDLIATGVASSSRANLVKLMDIIKSLLRDFAETAKKGVKLSSVAEEVKKRIDELGQQSFKFSEYEVRDALKMLEDEGFVAIIGNRKSPTIRLIAAEY